MTLEEIIRQYTPWLMGYLLRLCGDRGMAEDMVQEVWLLVYRHFDRYREEGHMAAWLRQIGKNVYLRQLCKAGGYTILSLDDISADMPAYVDTLTDGTTAADPVLADTLSETVQHALEQLPPQQKQAVICRYLWDMTIPETAEMLAVTESTVKSNTSRGLAAMRRSLGTTKTKGADKMECREAMEYLYAYGAALPKLANRAAVAAHVETCEHCRGIVSALQKLIPQMCQPDEETYSHWNIQFPGQVTYSYIGAPVPEYEWCQKKLTEWNGHIPGDCNWFGSGFTNTVTPGRHFDNEGNEMPFECTPDPENGSIRLRHTYMQKIYPYLHTYSTIFAGDGYWNKIVLDQGGVYHGHMHNCFGSPVKTALYQMIPKAATHIRIQQGNGILDCGEYYAVYAERYTGENEIIALTYTYTMEE